MLTRPVVLNDGGGSSASSISRSAGSHVVGRAAPIPTSKSSSSNTLRREASRSFANVLKQPDNSSAEKVSYNYDSGSGVSSSYNDNSGSSYYDLLKSIQEDNRKWNSDQADKLNEFNASEAQKQRDWEEYMSSSAYQRAVKDLQAAGLNPALAYMNLSPAATPSGATASGSKAASDNSLANITSLIAASISASSAQSVAQMYVANQRYMAENYPSSIGQLLTRVINNLGTDTSGNKPSSSNWLYGLRSKIGELVKFHKVE